MQERENMSNSVGIWHCPVCGKVESLELPTIYLPNNVCRCQSRYGVYNYMSAANDTAMEFDKATEKLAEGMKR